MFRLYTSAPTADEGLSSRQLFRILQAAEGSVLFEEVSMRIYKQLSQENCRSLLDYTYCYQPVNPTVANS